MKYGRWLKPLSSAAAIVMAFLIAGFVVLLSGEDPGTAYRALFRGAFGSVTGLKNTVRYSIPIIMLGFSFAICNDCGFFNIGQEGQMYAAAIAAAGAALVGAGLPRGLQLLLIIAAAVIAGGILCLIPAVLKFVFGVNEVIVSMLLNYILVLLTNYLLLNSSIGITGRTTPSSIEFEPRIEAWVLAGLSALIMLAYALFMKNTVPGYRLRMTGRNADFAKANGIRVRKIILSACFLGGAFSALSAVGEILGIYHRVYDGFAENLGFYGMTAALIGSQSTSGLIFGGIILGALQSGSVSLTVMTDVSSDMVLVVQGFVMLFATVNILRILGKGGNIMDYLQLLNSSIRLSAPVILIAMGGLFALKVDVFNMALDAFALIGCFFSIWGAYVTGTLSGGFFIGILCTVLFSLVYAVFVLEWEVNPVVCSVAMITLANGLTRYLMQPVFGTSGNVILSSELALPTVHISLLDHLPVLGKILNNQTILVYLSLLLPFGIYVFLKYTEIGLSMRACGQSKETARSAGLKVKKSSIWR